MHATISRTAPHLLIAVACAGVAAGCQPEKVKISGKSSMMLPAGSPVANYQEKKSVAFNVGGSMDGAVILKDAAEVIQTFSGSGGVDKIDLNRVDDFKPLSIELANLIEVSSGNVDLIVLGVSDSSDDTTFVLVYKGAGDGTFPDDPDTKTKIDSFRPTTGAMAVGNFVARLPSMTTADKTTDLAIAGSEVVGGDMQPQMIILPWHTETFDESDESIWVREDSALDVDDVLPGDVDAGIFGYTVSVDEETTDDLWLRYSGKESWTLLLKTGDRSLSFVP